MPESRYGSSTGHFAATDSPDIGPGQSLRDNGFSRRSFLTGTFGVATFGLLNTLFPAAPLLAQTSPTQTASGTAADAFLQVSSRLTGRGDLDEKLAGQFYNAFEELFEGFGKDVHALADYLEAHPEMDVGAVPGALEEQNTAVAGLPIQIVTAWYMGEVKYNRPEEIPEKDRSSDEPPEPRVIVVAYADALMFDPMQPILSVPSHCGGGRPGRIGAERCRAGIAAQ